MFISKRKRFPRVLPIILVTVLSLGTVFAGSFSYASAADTSDQIHLYTASGYLEKGGTYRMYAVALKKGSYLQARLTVPADNSIDYDLYLFDSSLNVKSSSDYVTYLNASGSEPEDLEYVSDADETLYLCAFSTKGGSTEKQYTLDYSVSDTLPSGESMNGNAKEATVLDIADANALINGDVNSPIDADWYKFVVGRAPEYDKIRFSYDRLTVGGRCSCKLYRNIGTDCIALQELGSGFSGEIALPEGTYYLKISSLDTLSSFNRTTLETYQLSIMKVSRVDEIQIVRYEGHNARKVTYSGFSSVPHYRIDASNGPGTVTVVGVAYYYDDAGNRQPAVNARLTGTMDDRQWEEVNHPEFAKSYASADAGLDGFFSMDFHPHSPMGGYRTPIDSGFIHHIDIIDVDVRTGAQPIVSVQDILYMYKNSTT